MRLIDKTPFLNDNDKVSLPGTLSLVRNEKNAGFFELGALWFESNKLKIEQRASCLYSYTTWKHGDKIRSFNDRNEYPHIFSNFYFCLRFLEQADIDSLLGILNVVLSDVQKLTGRKDYSINILIHGKGRNLDSHSHHCTEGERVLTYAVRLGKAPAVPVMLIVDDLSIPMLAKSTINRIIFDASVKHEVKLSVEDESLYIWFIFDGITLLDSSFYPPSDTLHFWNLDK